MVAPAADPADQFAPPPRIDEAPLLNRLNTIVSRVEDLSDSIREHQEKIADLGHRMDDNSYKTQQAMEHMQRQIEERLQTGLGEVIRANVQPELATLRAPMEAQSVRLAAVETRLERVETIQVESMNALDVRFADLGFQTRLALSGGGLVTLAAILIVLLR